MKKGQCPKCKSKNVVVSRESGGVGFDVLVRISSGRGWDATQKWTTYLCLDCGFYENYVEDREKLDKIKSDPEKMGWNKIK